MLFDAEEDGGAGGKESQFVHTKVHELFKDLVSGWVFGDGVETD